MRTWTLELDRRARGDLVLLVDVRTPRVAADSYAPHEFNILNADRQNGHVAVEAGSEQHVQIVTTGDDGQSLQTVDPVDFPAAYYRPVERVVAGFQYVRPGWTLAVSGDPLRPACCPHRRRALRGIAERAQQRRHPAAPGGSSIHRNWYSEHQADIRGKQRGIVGDADRRRTCRSPGMRETPTW